jgi:hypothetical protein
MTNWSTPGLCTCGHNGYQHHPGSYKNADQRAIHYGCNADGCSCTHFTKRVEGKPGGVGLSPHSYCNTCGHPGLEHLASNNFDGVPGWWYPCCVSGCKCSNYVQKGRVVSFEDDVKKVIDEHLPKILEAVSEQVADKVRDLLKRQGGGVITRKPVLMAPVISVSPDTVDPLHLAIYESMLHHKWVCVVYDSEDVLPSIPDLERLPYSDKIKRISHVVGQQQVQMYNGATVFIRAANSQGGRGLSVDFVIRVLPEGTSLYREQAVGPVTATES